MTKMTKTSRLRIPRLESTDTDYRRDGVEVEVDDTEQATN